jgi:hypothetical protein
MENQFFWSFFSFILTIMIFSYIFGDNPLFRIATYFFIGVTSAYVLILLINQVIIPKLISPLLSSNNDQIILNLIPLLLSLLLLFKLFDKRNQIGNIPLAILVGSGSAIILSSSFMGTLVPMIDMVTDSFSLSTLSGSNFFGGLFMILGVFSTLLYFQQSKITNATNSEQSKFFSILNYFGKFFIGVTLGSIFAGVIISASIALIERLNFIFSFIYNIIIR